MESFISKESGSNNLQDHFNFSQEERERHQNIKNEDSYQEDEEISINTRISPEIKRKREEALVKYIIRNFYTNSILEFSCEIKFENFRIRRNFFIGDNFDLLMFADIINELFDFSGKSWMIKLFNFSLIGSPEDEKISFNTQSTKKEYYGNLLTLKKLKLKNNDKFVFTYDIYNEKWQVNCHLISLLSSKQIIEKNYKNEKERSNAFIKLKSILRPILTSGENQSPPEGLGGPSDFSKFLSHKEDIFNPYTLKYSEYYRDTFNIDNLSKIDYLIEEFDEVELQESLGSINYLKYYQELQTNSHNFENIFDESINLESKNVKVFGNNDDSVDESNVQSDKHLISDKINSKDLKFDLSV
jgi:hypothetical protein